MVLATVVLPEPVPPAMPTTKGAKPTATTYTFTNPAGPAYGTMPVEAPNEEFAEAYAREQYGRRGESTALWVVPREAVHEIDDFADELQKNYHRVDGYPLKEKLGRARERAEAARTR